MAEPKYVNSLKIIHRDNSVEEINTTKLAFTGGIFLDAEPSKEYNSITLEAGPDKGTQDAELIKKFRALLQGGNGIYKGVPYEFSGAPYYCATINGIEPLDGHIFLNHKFCTHAGLFEDLLHPTLSNGAISEYGENDVLISPGEPGGPNIPGTPINSKLEITDVCKPCVDCGEYAVLYEYLDALKEALEDKKNQIYTNTDEIDRQNNILKLLRQTMLYWNNTVHRTSWRCNAEADGGEINAACMITNHFEIAIPAGLTLSATFLEMPSGGSGGFIIDSVVPSDWTESDYEVTGLEGEKSIIETTWVYLASPEAILIPFVEDVLVGDTLDILGSSDPSMFIGVHVVLAVNEDNITLAFKGSVVGSTEGTASFEKDIKLLMVTNRALAIGESIRLYVGAVTPTYTGKEAKAIVSFNNNISTIDSSFAGYPDNKEVKTNKMVVLTEDQWV